jgi:hypothetical protein
VQAAVLAGARAQMMGGIEAEALGYLDHGPRISRLMGSASSQGWKAGILGPG